MADYNGLIAYLKLKLEGEPLHVHGHIIPVWMGQPAWSTDLVAIEARAAECRPFGLNLVGHKTRNNRFRIEASSRTLDALGESLNDTLRRSCHRSPRDANTWELLFKEPRKHLVGTTFVVHGLYAKPLEHEWLKEYYFPFKKPL